MCGDSSLPLMRSHTASARRKVLNCRTRTPGYFPCSCCFQDFSHSLCPCEVILAFLLVWALTCRLCKGIIIDAVLSVRGPKIGVACRT